MTLLSQDFWTFCRVLKKDHTVKASEELMLLVSAGQVAKMEYPFPRIRSVVDCEGREVSGFGVSEYPKGDIHLRLYLQSTRKISIL